MKCDVAVTFEFETRAPQTVRFTGIEATGPQTIASRALREARRQARPVNWTSIVVLLQRLDAVPEGDADQEAAGELESEADSN